AGGIGGISFDDIGRITTIDPVTGAATYQYTHPVFHHQFFDPGEVGSRPFSHAFLQSFGGTTAPASPTPPQDRAGDLFFSGGADQISFPDVDNGVFGTEGVAVAAIDVSLRSRPAAVIFYFADSVA